MGEDDSPPGPWHPRGGSLEDRHPNRKCQPWVSTCAVCRPSSGSITLRWIDDGGNEMPGPPCLPRHVPRGLRVHAGEAPHSAPAGSELLKAHWATERPEIQLQPPTPTVMGRARHSPRPQAGHFPGERPCPLTPVLQIFFLLHKSFSVCATI